eukprot:m.277809 g.277809  ORF g.277809 m.277809 type:complete len:92 (+) comp40610_c1_seq14:111-386(+)
MSMLSLEMDTMQFAWGMSFEPALSQVSIASGIFLVQSRLLLHGNMSINMNRLNAGWRWRLAILTMKLRNWSWIGKALSSAGPHVASKLAEI